MGERGGHGREGDQERRTRQNEKSKTQRERVCVLAQLKKIPSLSRGALFLSAIAANAVAYRVLLS